MKIDIKEKENQLYQEALIWMGYRYAIGLTEESKAIQQYKLFRDIEYDTPEFHALAEEISNYLRRKKIKDIVDLRDRLVENDMQWFSVHYALGRHSYAAMHCHDIVQYGREVLDDNRKEFMAFDIRREISEHLKWSLNFHQPIGSEDRLNPIEMLMNFLKGHSITSVNEIARYKRIEAFEESDGTISFHTELAEDETGSTVYLSFSSSIDDLLGWNDLASYFDPKCHKNCKVRFNNEDKTIEYFDSWHRCSYQEGIFPYQKVKIAIESYEKNPSLYCYISEEYVIEDEIWNNLSRNNMDYRIIQPIIRRVLQTGHDGEFYVDKQSFALVKEIQKALSIFEPIEDDEARMIWLEIPRGTAEEWKNFEDLHDQYVESDIASYRKALVEEYPYEKRWFFLVTSTYRENTFLKISDRVHKYVIFTNRNLDGKEYAHDMSWFLEPLLHLVKQRIAEIAKNPMAYNQHIDEDLPYRQRFGRIKSRFLNRIVPERKLVVKDQKYCIQVMKELIRREAVYTSVKEGEIIDWEKEGVPAPFNTMSIRRFCKYYRIADTIFWKNSHYERTKKTVSIEDDVEYYQYHGLHNALKEYNLESEEDFKSFACDHYGELGLSRTNVRASQYYAGGKWIITLGVSYSSYVDKALEITVALYESGAPFVFNDAENLLHILEETGTVRISAFTFHDYLQSDDDEGIISVPYIEDCDKEGELTRQQYDDIVHYAEWEPNEKVALDKRIPLNAHVYHLIRDEVNEPITLSEIRKRIEKKYDCYLGIAQKSGYSGYYHVGALRNRQMSAGIEGVYYPTFNEALKALILSIKIIEQETNENRTE